MTTVDRFRETGVGALLGKKVRLTYDDGGSYTGKLVAVQLEPYLLDENRMCVRLTTDTDPNGVPFAIHGTTDVSSIT